MLRLIGFCLLGLALLVIVVAVLWHEYLRRHDEQLLATRVMEAVNAIGTPVTSEQVRQHIETKTGLRYRPMDVRVLLDCMEAEGTLKSERPPRPRSDGEWPPRRYTLTPRFAAGFQ